MDEYIRIMVQTSFIIGDKSFLEDGAMEVYQQSRKGHADTERVSVFDLKKKKKVR